MSQLQNTKDHALEVEAELFSIHEGLYSIEKDLKSLKLVKFSSVYVVGLLNKIAEIKTNATNARLEQEAVNDGE